MVDVSWASAIVGIGETEYSRNSGMLEHALVLQAATRAIADAGLKPSDIDGIIVNPQLQPGSAPTAHDLGIQDLRYTGSSGGQGIVLANALIAAGLTRAVLIVGGGNGRSGHRAGQGGGGVRGLASFDAPYGVLAPVHSFAIMARRHMIEYGTTSEQLGAIAVAQRKHAQLNPKATMKAPMTIEDHQNSRFIADPLHLLDCSLETDGAAALVVTSAERARDLPQKPVFVAGAAQCYGPDPGNLPNRADLTANALGLIAAQVYRQAGITPQDIDFAEIMDQFSYSVLCQLEALGFCRRGEGGAFVEGGRIELGGELPVNTHGGLLSQAHIWGMNHQAEAVKQLRGEAGPGQVPGARVGLVTDSHMSSTGMALVLTN